MIRPGPSCCYHAFVRRLLAVLALALLLAASVALLFGPAFVPLLRPLIARRFPAVAWISAEELAQDRRLTLVDARSPAEYAVSHIEGARLLRADLSELPRDAPIVVYCSVGYRSAEAIERLRRQGFSRLRNLEGGIFAWANAGRPLVGADGQTTGVVHAYGAPWNLLLARQRRARPP